MSSVKNRVTIEWTNDQSSLVKNKQFEFPGSNSFFLETACFKLS